MNTYKACTHLNLHKWSVASVDALGLMSEGSEVNTVPKLVQHDPLGTCHEFGWTHEDVPRMCRKMLKKD